MCMLEVRSPEQEFLSKSRSPGSVRGSQRPFLPLEILPYSSHLHFIRLYMHMHMYM